MGAMASKKARLSAPVAVPIDRASDAAVSGPVATMVVPSDGKASTRSRTISTLGCSESAFSTFSENTSRSTASADPAGTCATSAAFMISELHWRIS